MYHAAQSHRQIMSPDKKCNGMNSGLTQSEDSWAKENQLVAIYRVVDVIRFIYSRRA